MNELLKKALGVTLQAEAEAAVSTAGAITAAPAEAADEEATSAKEAIYVKIAEFVKGKTGKRIGKSGGRVIYDLVIAESFAAAAKEGTFRFNGGFGSLHVRKYGAGKRRLPSGAVTEFGEREKVRYEEGVVVSALVEHDGDLEAALKSRQGTETAAPAAAPAEKPTDGDVNLT